SPARSHPTTRTPSPPSKPLDHHEKIEIKVRPEVQREAGHPPISLADRLVCDVGAGTGVASQAAAAAGAHVVATDVARGMLAVDHAQRPPAALADATCMPFPDAAFGGVVAAYCYNHLEDPVAGLREARRITISGGPVLASAYAEDDTHPVKAASEQALSEIGWFAPDFYIDIKTDAAKLATLEGAEDAAEASGLRAINVEAVRVPFPKLTLDDLIEWRLGMAHIAWFVADLPADPREALVARTRDLLGADVPTLVRSVIHITALA
ncbi:MAG: class I SAM-dependent methyltransferase, partial [Actinomycetota bacterium]|nr:class I SAM-dependent methyltransferase [Actinomycetota bacterium]